MNFLRKLRQKMFNPVLAKLNILDSKFADLDEKLNALGSKKDLLPNRSHPFLISQLGYCPICEQEATFTTSAPFITRESLVCSKCGSIQRQRALMEIINRYYPNWRQLTVHESSPGNCSIAEKLKNECREYSCSQYYPDRKSGEVIDGFRNEDLENMTFNDSSFDIFITQDVMEHIYNPDKAFREIFRILKPGGAHIFTVPLESSSGKTEVWAKRGSNGEPIFLHEPEYHGNPISSEGSPCTMHYSYDIIDIIRECSGLNTIIEKMCDMHKGICDISQLHGLPVEVFVSVKK